MTLGVSDRETAGESRDNDIPEERVPLGLGNRPARALETEEEARVGALCTARCETSRFRARWHDANASGQGDTDHHETNDRQRSHQRDVSTPATETALPEDVRSHAANEAIVMPRLKNSRRH